MTNLSPLETAVLAAITALHPKVSDILREQIAAARVTLRENTGGGLIVEFAVARDAPPLPASFTSTDFVVSEVATLRLWFMAVMRGGYLYFIDGTDIEGLGLDTTGIDFLTAPFTPPQPVPMNVVHPPGTNPWRIALAFLVAPALAALLYAACYPLYAGLPSYAERVIWTAAHYAALATYPATILLGVPLFMAFRPRLNLTALNCALAGIFIAATPAIILAFMPEPLHLAAGKGLSGAIIFAGVAAIVGAISGLAFRLIARPRLTHPPHPRP